MNRIERIRQTVEMLLVERGFERQPVGKLEPTTFDPYHETYWARPGCFSRCTRTVINHRTGQPADVLSFQGTTVSVIGVWPKGRRPGVSVRLCVYRWGNGGCTYWGPPITTTWGPARINSELDRAVAAISERS